MEYRDQHTNGGAYEFYIHRAYIIYGLQNTHINLLALILIAIKSSHFVLGNERTGKRTHKRTEFNSLESILQHSIIVLASYESW